MHCAATSFPVMSAIAFDIHKEPGNVARHDGGGR